MPFIRVWVDDSDYECDGGCDSAQHKFEAIQLSLVALRDDRVEEAITILGDACGDADTLKRHARDRELAGLLALWRGLPEPREGFLTFAHDKRKASAT